LNTKSAERRSQNKTSWDALR